MNRKYFTLALFAGLSLGSAANASVVWNFTSGVTANTDIGTSHSFASTGGSPNFSITAYGVHNDGSATDLFAKSAGATETGLGLANGSETEIDNENTFFSTGDPKTGHAIELDVSSLPTLTTLQFLINSVQSGETFTWGVKDTSTTGALSGFGGGATLSQNGSTNQQTFNFQRDGASHEFIAIFVSANDSSDVLLTSATLLSGGNQNPTPEPRFIGLLLVGMLAIPVIRRRFAPQQ
jgi:hypothetical protein